MNVAQLGLPLTLAVFVAAAIAVLFAGLAPVSYTHLTLPTKA